MLFKLTAIEICNARLWACEVQVLLMGRMVGPASPDHCLAESKLEIRSAAIITCPGERQSIEGSFTKDTHDARTIGRAFPKGIASP